VHKCSCYSSWVEIRWKKRRQHLGVVEFASVSSLVHTWPGHLGVISAGHWPLVRRLPRPLPSLAEMTFGLGEAHIRMRCYACLYMYPLVPHGTLACFVGGKLRSVRGDSKCVVDAVVPWEQEQHATLPAVAHIEWLLACVLQ
jgi:hypothetical protein